uniref:Genome polyprotein n=1 Tax=Cowpea aphid-borne mosaic virus TaxID=12199 RepID=A0A1L2ILP7_9POTV|nr:polyprotein [Cowpea aphid-borne mosaic virus]
MTSIMFGDFQFTQTVKAAHEVVQVEEVLVPVTKWVKQIVPVGCGTRCGGTVNYSKSSLRRAIAEGDLTRSGACHYCGTIGIVGGRAATEMLVAITEQQVQKREVKVVVPATTISSWKLVDRKLVDEGVKMIVDLKDEVVEAAKVIQTQKNHRSNLQASKKLLSDYAKAQIGFADSFSRIAGMEQKLLIDKYSSIRKTKRGAVINRVSLKKAQERRQTELIAEKEHEKFLAGEFENKAYFGSVHEPIDVSHSESVGFRTVHYRRTPKTCKPRSKVTQVRGSWKVQGQIMQLARKTGICVEFIERGKAKPLKVNFTSRYGSTLPKVTLPHEGGRYVHEEVSYNKHKDNLMALVKYSTYKSVHQSIIKRGDSGLVYPPQEIKALPEQEKEIFIIRGRQDGVLINALDWHSEIASVQHYSHQLEIQFFQGWKKVFDKLVPHTEDHECTVDYSNEQCGELAASLCQTLYPVKKLSCRKCRFHIKDLSWEEYKEFIAVHFGCCAETLKDQQSIGFKNVQTLVERAVSEGGDVNLSLEIARLTQNYTSTPMLQIQDINKALMKGSSATKQELDQALKQLLAMTQWWKNHMELTGEDALKTFRNKRASKAMLNPSLLCDNQLDKNGNFIWGERGRHSKRFFSNFFDEVVPSEGYGKYTIRRNPNGFRKLAIGSLVVPLDLDRARVSMKGESVTKQPITKACVSVLDKNFVYPCCCVTLDNGQPLYSDYKSPTKRHLVVGSSGDPKYIDLPATDSDRMYIAKEGYCYLNIFLAMLVNVNEDEAKDFTKMVRDVLVPKLGTWPTMMDVATAAYMLTVFHPETKSAELPRILVDHESQTMHVIDSFGSLNTGYHVLKAGTVNQLIQFASNDLDSEMKFYKVGGSVQQRLKCETALISSIFKPKRMVHILETDPYILLMGLVSPSLLIHMFRMRHLEKGVQIWINKEQSVAKIFLILEQLTKKLVVNDVLLEQLRLISETAEPLHSLLLNCPKTAHSYNVAKDFLIIKAEMNSANETLITNGFFDMHESLDSAREKIYVDWLSKEWHALSLLEKFSVTWQLKRFSDVTENSLIKKATVDKEKFSKRFVSACFLSAQTHLKESRICIANKIEQISHRFIGSVCGLFLNFIRRCYGDLIFLVNVSIVISLFVQMVSVLNNTMRTIRNDRISLAAHKVEKDEQTICRMYDLFSKGSKELPSSTQFLLHIEEVRPDLLQTAKYMITSDESVETQAKTANQLHLEKIVAFMALLTMCVDAERSDAIFKILNKLKSVFGTMAEEVRMQSLDDLNDIEECKKLTVDFEVSTSHEPTSTTIDVSFEGWWNRQLQQNRVVPHYRSTGEFMEFTRATAATVANSISLSAQTEFLIRGAVGSGKSTGLPHHLSKKGKVLLLEPTRPLAENVSKQLSQDPFFQNTTLRMRGLSRFGSSNITVMTSGFAFHYYVNNPHQLNDFDFIILDECHVLDSPSIAFNCALKDFSYAGKLIKVSATPPGRECEFTTQYPVKLKIEENLSFQDFVQAQGTGTNADMIQHGNNLLIYVASYNEVDQISKYLLDKGFKVTKVDGRTMQMGRVEIETSGTPSKPHFIVATNIIENGVTLDVDCVIDFGLKVVADLDTDSRCVRYNKKSVNYGERIQRLGRVGRHKPGFALRIGSTERGMAEIPEFIATEAAFLSFAYGLPVTTQNVTTNILSKCTVQQAKSALNFELTPFFTTHFVKYDGSIHPEIHKLLKQFKLRESEMVMNKKAIPYQYTNQWISVREYKRLGIQVGCDDGVKLPFYVNGVPDTLFAALWDTVCKYRYDAGFGRINAVSSTKISYTLSTEPTAVPRTIAIIDHLISEEMMKKNHFDTVASSLTGHSFSLSGIAEGIRKRYLRDYSAQNIETLQQARAQLLEFNCNNVDVNKLHEYEDLGILNTVCLQSKHEVAKFLGLKGKWDGSKFRNDLLLVVFTIIGGGWMMWDYFSRCTQEGVITQGKKRMTQKLKFRDAYDRKVGREVYADDYTMEHTFGEAYTKKGKEKGSHKTKGMGRKTRNFIHMYGVEPENYTTIRFVDPLTGFTMDENPRVDIRIVQDEMGEVRQKLINHGELESELIRHKPGIQAYFLGKGTEEALKVDLTPHRPTLLCAHSNNIAGYPERENELRQTGLPQRIKLSDVPAPNEEVGVESKSTYKGVRDYSGVSTLICRIVNSSDGCTETIFGIGYGSYIITNGHLFKRNNGTLTVKTWHGEYIVPNTTQLRIHFIEGKDAILIRMPKDFPPFAQRNCFRSPKKEERVCMIGTNFQEKSLRSTVSESSMIVPEGKGSFWVHWISTQDGDCGLPLVSVNDGHIVGFHGLTSNTTSRNFFIPFIDNFKEKYLDCAESLEWNKHWLWQPDKIAWGSLNLIDNQPKEEFKIAKLITDLFSGDVATQSKQESWLWSAMDGNLVACGKAESALVTKHVVKGKCNYFQQYLSSDANAANFFKPLMGAYLPSKLNREAFKKDFFKYNKPVVVGEVDFDAFEQAVDGVKMMMIEFGFSECKFVTDPEEIFDSLNMKASVGAQYKGKKQEYFATMDEFDRERLVYLSCERLFNGQKGLWNGSLKAELRPLEKVEANKTRTFTAAPIDTLLGAKVCVDDFNNQFYNFNLQCPWTVGMTKFYGGWDKLMRSLPDGWIYCHADGSQFDSSLTPLLLNAVLDLRIFFMEDWWVGQEMLENLYAEIVFTPILTPDGTVVKKFRGNNSGQPSTVVDNTLMVVISVYYSCIKAGWSERDVQERLVFFANGDDIILAVREDDVKILDTFTSSFGELGLNYDFSERTKKREELWFMSHQAKLVDNLYIPKLEQERIVSILEWDRSKELLHRTEAICAAMIEAWGYPELLQEIRKFYLWLLQKDEFKELASLGKAPYIAETALKKLYTDEQASEKELQRYLQGILETYEECETEDVMLQSGRGQAELDAGQDKDKGRDNTAQPTQQKTSKQKEAKETERDVAASSSGQLVPRLQKISKKMNLPMISGKVILDLNHLIEYKPAQIDLYNTRASRAQLNKWYAAIQEEYELDDDKMRVVMNGFMVWCIENGTSPDVNGVWTMMDGDEQVEFPLKPIVENAKPTLRQIMHHFSDAAEAYIEMRNSEGFYMPRYGLLRNLRDKSLARYAFDFYEVTSKTSDRAREAIAQMKAAALSNVNTRMFGLDGNVATTSENTERHTATDVNQNMHSLLGMRHGQ